MLKKAIFNLFTPIVCLLTSAAIPFQLSAGTCCPPVCCEEDPCCEDRPWLRNAAMLVAALAAGAGGGAIVAATTDNNGRRGDTGAAGAGFTISVVPPGQPGAGTPVTSLTFTFTTPVAISAGAGIVPYVTTPDGRTFTGAPFTGVLGSTSTVTIPTGPFYDGVYNVGVIIPAGTASLTGLVTVDLSSINGVATSPTLNDTGIVVAAVALAVDDTDYNAGFPYPPIP